MGELVHAATGSGRLSGKDYAATRNIPLCNRNVAHPVSSLRLEKNEGKISNKHVLSTCGIVIKTLRRKFQNSWQKNEKNTREENAAIALKRSFQMWCLVTAECGIEFPTDSAFLQLLLV